MSSIHRSSHRRNNRRDRGRLVPQLLGWGTNNILVPQLLGRNFQKARNFTASVTRMHDLASEFSKIFLTTEGGDTLSHSTPSPAFDRARGTSALVLGPKPWSPLNFSAVVAPLALATKVFHIHDFIVSHGDDRGCPYITFCEKRHYQTLFVINQNIHHHCGEINCAVGRGPIIRIRLLHGSAAWPTADTHRSMCPQPQYGRVTWTVEIRRPILDSVIQ